MTAAPIPSEPVPALLAPAAPRAIRDALIDSERDEFEQAYREAMAEAATTLDLTGVLRVLDAYAAIARKTQQHGVEAHRRMLAAVHYALATGEPPPGSKPWSKLKAELD